MDTVLLTGGTGYLGARVARRLLADGFAVTLLARAASSLTELERIGIANRVAVARLSPDWREIRATVAASRPVAAVHLAAKTTDGDSAEELRRFLEANVTLPTLLLGALRDAGARAFVNTGTGGQTSAPTRRPDGYAPYNFYAATKQAFEDLLESFCVTGMAASTLRLFDTYGPGDTRGKVVELLARAVLGGTKLEMSPGMQVIDLVHADDVAAAFSVALGRLLAGGRGHAVHGVSGTRLDLRTLASRLSVLARRPSAIHWGGLAYRPREVMLPWTGFAPLPGWRPQVPLDDGLREVVAGLQGGRA